MAEYIEREAILSEIERREALMVGDKRISVDAMKHFIKNRPAADVAPVRHARWWKQDDYSCCSVCGQSIADECVPWFKFCPQCGAKMDLEG